MKGLKLISITVIVAVCILVLGIIISVIGWALNATHYKNRNYKDLESFDKVISENITRIDMSLNICELKVVKGDEFKIEAENFRKDYLTYKIKDEKLIINEEEERTSWWNFDIFKMSNNYYPKLTIYVPDDMNFEEIYIELGIGTSEINNLNADKLTFDCGVGSVKGTKLTAGKCRIESGVGAVTMKDIDFKGLTASNGVGEISLEGNMTGLMDIENGIGKIDLMIYGRKSDYYVNADDGIGAIKVNGSKYHKNDYSKSTENTINVENGIGEISITFE